MTVRMGLVLDCGDPEALAEFWAAALGYTSVGSAGSYVMLLPAEGDGPQLLLQKVPEPKAGKNRMHFDVLGDTSSLLAAGATLRRARDGDTEPDGAIEWDVLADPEGNEFCVFTP